MAGFNRAFVPLIRRQDAVNSSLRSPGTGGGLANVPMPSGNPSGPIIPPVVSNWWNNLPWSNQTQWAPPAGDPLTNPDYMAGVGDSGFEAGFDAGVEVPNPNYRPRNLNPTGGGGNTIPALGAGSLSRLPTGIQAAVARGDYTSPYGQSAESRTANFIADSQRFGGNPNHMPVPDAGRDRLENLTGIGALQGYVDSESGTIMTRPGPTNLMQPVLPTTPPIGSFPDSQLGPVAGALPPNRGGLRIPPRFAGSQAYSERLRRVG